jgi:predicted kinase
MILCDDEYSATMKTPRPTTLYLICGKIAAGKSTLARRLATRPTTLLITMDDWMSILFPTENRTIEDFTLLSARLRAVMGPHVVEILRQELSVVLDFPANTVRWRSWMRSLIAESNGTGSRTGSQEYPIAMGAPR